MTECSYPPSPIKPPSPWPPSQPTLDFRAFHVLLRPFQSFPWETPLWVNLKECLLYSQNRTSRNSWVCSAPHSHGCPPTLLPPGLLPECRGHLVGSPHLQPPYRDHCSHQPIPTLGCKGHRPFSTTAPFPLMLSPSCPA